MKSAGVLIVIILISLFSMSSVYAAMVKVEWVEPEKFRDIEPANGSKKRFQKRVMNTIEKHFQSLAEKLPKDTQLIINITDVDLAGDVHLGNIHRIRIVKEPYYPRIEMSYQLLYNDKTVRVSGETKLKDMNFMGGIHTALRNNDFLNYEKIMLTTWFNKTFVN